MLCSLLQSIDSFANICLLFRELKYTQINLKPLPRQTLLISFEKKITLHICLFSLEFHLAILLSIWPLGNLKDIFVAIKEFSKTKISLLTSSLLKSFQRLPSDTCIRVVLFKIPKLRKLILFIQIQIADCGEVVVSGTTVLLYLEYRTPFILGWFRGKRSWELLHKILSSTCKYVHTWTCKNWSQIFSYMQVISPYLVCFSSKVSNSDILTELGRWLLSACLLWERWLLLVSHLCAQQLCLTSNFV